MLSPDTVVAIHATPSLAQGLLSQLALIVTPYVVRSTDTIEDPIELTKYQSIQAKTKFRVFLVGPKQSTAAELAEAVYYAAKDPLHTVFSIIEEEDGQKLTVAQKADFFKVGELIHQCDAAFYIGLGDVEGHFIGLQNIF